MLTTLALLPLLLPGQEGTRPNVLLVIVDDLNDWVGALGGHPQARTPNIDALAARGVSFTNAHCQAPVCTPSRASLFTGRLPSTTGMYFLQPALAQARELDGVTTLVERFAAEGYDTLGVGKLHHGSGEARFFKEYGGGMGGFGPMPPEKLSYPLGHPLWDWGPYPETDALMPDSKVADWAVAKLGEERDEPFFLAVGFWRPHVPMYVPEPWFEAIGREEDVRLPDVLTTDRDDLSRYAKELTIGLPAPRHEWMVEHDAWRGAVHAYLASSSFVDARVGRVLRALEESPHADDTIVVLLSDHGFHLGEKQRWAKRSLWEESTRVPLIIAGPGIAAANCDAPVGLVDLYPTLLELCGLEPSEGLDGNSLLGLVREPTVSWPHAAITSFGPGNHAVRTRSWRYIRYADGSEELYDHEVDPREWHNLASQDGRSDVLAELRAFLPKHDADPVAGTAGAGFEAMHAAEAATGQADEHRAALERPTNFLVILADDLGFSDVGCYGGEIETPNLDALAAGGLRFTQFYNSGRCWPTRAALMTGYYAQQVRRDKLPGVRSGGGGVRPSWARLLPEMLRPSGYRTYHSGKWHIDGQVLENGFDRSYRLNDHDHFFNPRDHTEDDEGLPPVESGTGYYATSAIADHAIRCLQDHAAEHADKPFFQFLAFTTPHFPLHALPEDIARYRDAYLRDWQAVREERSLRQKESGLLDARLSEVERDVGPPYHFAEAMDALGPGEVNRPLPWEELTAEEQRFQATKMAIHAAMVDRMDRDIGRVLEQLREMDAYDDTLILFLSDNGASAEIMVRGDGHDRAAAPGSAKSYLCLGPGWSNVANTPFRRHKTWVHEGGIATPMIAHWPRGIAARGEFRRTPGHVIDVVPTILELAGAQPPTTLDGTSLPSAPGKSLVPALAADVQVERDHLWWSHEGHRALRIGDWKLVAASGDAWELFDLSTDRAETSDLAAAHPERVARMAELWKTRENEFLELVRD